VITGTEEDAVFEDVFFAEETGGTEASGREGRSDREESTEEGSSSEMKEEGNVESLDSFVGKTLSPERKSADKPQAAKIKITTDKRRDIKLFFNKYHRISTRNCQIK